MMDEQGLLVVRHLRVENVNAVAGLTWGFPALSAFLGFVHALSRRLPPDLGLELTGCGIVCHEHQAQAFQPRGWGDHVFALTRNPLTKEGATASFIEEGRMQMTVSLLVPMRGAERLGKDDLDELAAKIKGWIETLRLAGGTPFGMKSAELLLRPEDPDKEEQFVRQQVRMLLPGFALVERTDLLAEHFRRCRDENAQAEPVDAWLDFAALKHRAESGEGHGNDVVEWRHVPKPGSGWLVPMAIGYRGISELHDPGRVAGARDAQTPFRFVEAVYSVGQWLSPHRVRSLDDLIWRFQVDPDAGWYLCRNGFKEREDQKAARPIY